MGKSSKSNGQRTDKETQSPVLNVFKQIMKLEKNNDPEKANLLRGKKKKKTLGSRKNADQVSDSSNTEIFSKNNMFPDKLMDNNTRSFQTESIAAMAGKKKEKKNPQKSPKDTPSCTSCILNTITKSEQGCNIALLAMLVVATATIALVVYRASCSTVKTEVKFDQYGSGLFKRNANENRQKIYGQGDPLDNFMKDGKFGFHDASLRESRNPFSSFGCALIDESVRFALENEEVSNSHENSEHSVCGLNITLNTAQNSYEPGRGIPDDLSAILEPGVIDDQSSDQLRDFYKRLLETDEQLKKFKASMPEDTLEDNNIFKMTSYRKKRSLKFNRKPENKTLNNTKDDKNNTVGFVVENRKVFVKYAKDNKIKKQENNNKVQENKMKRPFYKSNKKLQAMINVFHYKDLKAPPKKDADDLNKLKNNKHQTHETDNDIINAKYSNIDSFKSIQNTEEYGTKSIDKRPQRKLLQTNEEGDGKNDINEKEDKEQSDFKVDTNPMRNANQQETINKMKVDTGNTKNSLVPNFAKQVGYLIQHVVLQNLYNQPLRKVQGTDNSEVDNEVYIDDYSNNKFDGKNNLAQAYSDYGVLDGKKETTNEKNAGVEDSEKRVKLSIDGNPMPPQNKQENCKSVLSTAGNKIAEMIKNIQKHFNPIKKTKQKDHNPGCFTPQLENKEQIAPKDTFEKKSEKEDNLTPNDKCDKAEDKSTDIQNKDFTQTIRKGKRTLLSIEEDKKPIDDISTHEIATKNIDVSKCAEDKTKSTIKSETTTAKHDNNTNVPITETKEVNKTIVKRNAIDDGNSIFWNDVYDDEYGIDTEKNVRDKYSIQDNEFVKKSEVWFHNKMQKLKDKWRTNGFVKRFNVNGTDNESNDLKNKIIVKRAVDNEKQLEAESKETDFAALTANMKEVCKQAAAVVQQTRNIKTHEETSESQATTSLMQRLARLMNDLVEYQVEQKTCVKLPPDLRNFLVWLTTPAQRSRSSEDDGIFPDVYSANTPSYPDLMTDSPDALETAQALQDLLVRYQGMSDDDKSKMSGVKEYLESKLAFLNQRISGYDDIYHQAQNLRYRRNNLENPKKKPNKFWHFIHKHKPKSTDKEMKKIKAVNKNINGKKRNIHDVYFKAIAEAKKLTTIKSLH